MGKRGRPPHRDILTPREWEVLACIRDGLSNDEIANRLNISLDGVKYHVTEILSKLGLENRHDLARWRPEENPPQWRAVAAPLLFWRNIPFGWLPTAVAGSLAIAAAAGAGLLVWALVLAGGSSHKATDAFSPARAPYDGPLAAYAVVGLSNEPLASLYLKAIDPFTGAAVPGRQPIELGHDGVEALSPDGATIALGWAAAGTGGMGPNRLSFLDTATWQKRDTNVLEGISQLFWSPDESKIYVVTFTCFACKGAPPRLLTVDVATGQVQSVVQLPFPPFPTFLSPDGRTFYLFGRDLSGLQVANPPPPRLIAIDVATGTTRGEITFSDMLFGPNLAPDPSGGYDALYFPGLAMGPDGQRMYIAYPDSDRMAVVDLLAMRVERTVSIERQQASLMDRFLSLFADEAHAKGGPTNSASLYISADGRRLYYSRSTERPPADANGNYQTTAVGPWVLDPSSLHVTKELGPAAMASHGFLTSVSTRYIFAARGLQIVVLDLSDLHQLSSGTIGIAVYDLLVGPAPPAAR